MGEWYYAKGSQQFGPVTTDELKRRLAHCEVAITDLVWTTGMDNWEPAQNRVELMSPAAPAQQVPLNYGGYVPPNTAIATSSYAGFWLRFVAWIIDSIVLGVIIAILSLLTYRGLASLMTANGAGMRQIHEVYHGLGIFLRLGLWWLYFAIMESSVKQATLGKLALGLRVTDLEGKRISFARASGRLFSKILSGIIFCIGYMMAGWTVRKQALHVLMADTLVLKRVMNFPRPREGTQSTQMPEATARAGS